MSVILVLWSRMEAESPVAVVFDMDGVLWYGGPHSPIEGAAQALKALDSKQVIPENQTK